MGGGEAGGVGIAQNGIEMGWVFVGLWRRMGQLVRAEQGVWGLPARAVG